MSSTNSGKPNQIDRRRFLKYAATAVITGAVAGVSGYLAGVAQPRLPASPVTTAQNLAASPDKAQLSPLKIGYLPQLPNLLSFVAVERGFFENLGIKAELSVMSGIERLVNGDVDIAPATTAGPLALAEQRGLFLKMLHPAMFEGTSPVGKSYAMLSLYVKKGSEIKTLKDLKGKLLAEDDHSVLPVILKKAGVDPAEVKFKTAEKTVDAIVTGQIDAAIVPLPGAISPLKKGVIEPLIDPPILPEKPVGRNSAYVAAFGDPAPHATYWTTEAILSKEPQLVRLFTQALALAAAWVNHPENFNDAAQIATKWTKNDSSLVNEVLPQAGFFAAYPEGFTDGARFLQLAMDALMTAGIMTSPLDVKKFEASLI